MVLRVGRGTPTETVRLKKTTSYQELCYPSKQNMCAGGQLMGSKLTKKRFESLLKKAAQPVKKSAPKEIGSSTLHPSDGYTGTRKHQGKIEGKED